ncbi:MAG TPA: hypothetical protein PK961_03355 [bacterium]|nr:hypothetical protein [bacterium]
MSIVTLLIGVGITLFGLSTLYLRLTNPEHFAKLAAMRQMWGHALGTAMHWFFYTIVQLVLGPTLIFLGAKGHSIF